MNIGMLWFDNDPKATLETKIKRAADFYRNKHGKAANTCFVNPKDLEPCQVDGIQVKQSQQVLRNHLWMGVEEQP